MKKIAQLMRFFCPQGLIIDKNQLIIEEGPYLKF